jgi:hypothetical protein
MSKIEWQEIDGLDIAVDEQGTGWASIAQPEDHVVDGNSVSLVARQGNELILGLVINCELTKITEAAAIITAQRTLIDEMRAMINEGEFEAADSIGGSLARRRARFCRGSATDHL